MKKIIIPFILIMATFSGCDKIDTRIQTSTVTPIIPPSTLKRNVLIEDFTGQACRSCPEATREIERLVDVYGDQIIPVSIHAGPFATNGADRAIFVTTDGTDYQKTIFKVSKFPSGMVSRVNAGTIYGRSEWEDEYTALAGDEPYADIVITNTYNTNTREVTINVDSEWLIDGDNGVNYKLQVYIIEDHITAEQHDGPTIISDYDHRHVFRGAINTSFGTIIPITLSGTTDSQSFNYKLDSTWKESNCEVVAFIYKEGPDYEVMQANIAHVTQ